MKNTLFILFRISIAIVLVGKVLNWFLDFSDETNRVMNMTMFGLIGIAYIVMGYVWDQLWMRIVITTCGSFLLVVNFFNNSVAVNLLGFACILIPMLLVRLDKPKRVERNAPQS